MVSRKITVFTPTYNRANFLPQLYDSLSQQNFKDFEWLIVDDGSTDHTEKLIKSWQQKTHINIRFFKQENSGKHIAINKGVSLAEGILFFIVDSDDLLLKNSLKTISDYYDIYKSKEKFGGIVGRRLDKKGNFIGTLTPLNKLYDTTLNLRYSMHIWGDFAEVYLTSVLKKYSFPNIDNEKFVPEGIVWNRIAQDYKVMFVNQGIYISEYLEDGLSSKMTKIRIQSPQLAMKYYQELATYKIPLKEKIKSMNNFWRFSFHHNKTYLKKFKTIGFIASIISLPLGFLMYLKDKVEYR